ncbi:MAG: sigma-70 family RNA polymerase sigma factor [Elusimicrobia bacterium]|nr:sigma-70 family RNA polymerase sigma factor [Elusimicrobiota bacterium]
METEEDRLVVKRVLAGDRQAFAVLVERHQGRVRQVCLGMLGNPAAADDAAQEAFLKAYRSLAAFRGDAAFSTWLTRLATNHCLDVLRAEARRPTSSWDALLEADGERVERLLKGDPDPAAAAEAADLAGRLLAVLPEQQRAALLLCETEGLSYEEIAEALACSVDSVKARLRRARRTLEEKLRHFMDQKIV